MPEGGIENTAFFLYDISIREKENGNQELELRRISII